MRDALTPNAITTQFRTGAAAGFRGPANWSQLLPTAPAAPSLLDLGGGLEKDIRNPYTQRWSFGFQRQLANRVVLDGSYVGSVSHKLGTFADVNPRQLNGQRLYPSFGDRQIRTGQGNSTYHSMQWRAERRFARGFQLTASYSWSRNLDSTSEAGGTINAQGTANNNTSVPVMDGGLRLDRGLSDYHRAHRFSTVYLWTVPGPHRGPWKLALGGWAISGIYSLQSGAPFTLLNGTDRNNDGQGGDRPDIGNPNAPSNTRAVVTASCPSGYTNPDKRVCVDPLDAFWLQGQGRPNAGTVGRNTMFAGGVNNLDASLFKRFPLGEGKRLELRWETLNALNHPQFVQIPAHDVFNTPAPAGGLPSRFLNRDFTNSGIRNMWVQIKLLF